MRAMGFSEQASKEAVRISFDAQNTCEELHEFFAALHATLESY